MRIIESSNRVMVSPLQCLNAEVFLNMLTNGLAG